MPRQHHHGGTESQVPRARTKPGQQIDRGRDLAIAGEVMLDYKGAVEAERLGLDIVLDEVAIAFRAVEFGTAAPCRRTAEQAEPHSTASSRHNAAIDTTPETSNVPNAVF